MMDVTMKFTGRPSTKLSQHNTTQHARVARGRGCAVQNNGAEFCHLPTFECCPREVVLTWYCLYFAKAGRAAREEPTALLLASHKCCSSRARGPSADPSVIYL